MLSWTIICVLIGFIFGGTLNFAGDILKLYSKIKEFHEWRNENE